MWATLIARLPRPSGPAPRLTLRRQLFDIAFAVLLVAGGVNYVFEEHRPGELLVAAQGDGPVITQEGPAGPPVVPYVILTLVLGCILTQRRRYPLAVLLLVAALTLPVVDDVPRVTYYTCVVAAYTAAAYSPYRMPTLVSVVTLGLLAWAFTRDGMPTVPQQYVGSGVLALVVLAGLALWLWRSRFEEGQLRLAAAGRERAAELRRAIESERSRIARELHDVVTHNVSVMLIQAGAARRTLPSSPDDAREALLAVEGAGRTAMAELRHVMGLLAPDADEAALTPQPGLSDLEALVTRVREAGMPVELTMVGTPRPVPAGEALAAYRVVQEGLTNAVKHAAGASAGVTVQYDETELRVEVADAGSRGPGPELDGSGRGLLGLRERLAVYGGTLRADPSPNGFRISAVIPLAPP